MRKNQINAQKQKINKKKFNYNNIIIICKNKLPSLKKEFAINSVTQ